MNCSNLQKRILDGDLSSRDVLAHIEECPGCARLLEKESRLNAAFGSLGAVDPPANFERDVFSEIRSRREKGMPAFNWLRPAFLVPTFAAVAVIGILLFVYGPFSGSGTRDVVEKSGPATEEPAPSLQPKDDQGRKENEPSSIVADAGKEAGPRKGPEKIEQRKPSSTPVDGGGSLDQATRPADPVKPLEGSPRSVDPGDNAPADRSFSPAEVFSEFGVEAVYGSTGWRVTGVRPNSIGANAGIMKGDILKALDGKPLTREPLEGTAVGGKRLRVLRDGKEIDLQLRPGD